MVSEDQAAHGVRYRLVLSPRKDIAPAAVMKYLPDGESGSLVVIRQHPVMLAPASALVTGVLLAAATVSRTGYVSPTLVLLVWLIWAFFLARAVVVVTNWLSQYIAVTEKHFLLTAGLMTRTVTVIKLTDLSGLTLERSPHGRLMGYGTFRIGSDSAGQLVIDYVPYAEQFYLELREKIDAAEQDAASG